MRAPRFSLLEQSLWNRTAPEVIIPVILEPSESSLMASLR
jgi:hypothetical protein